MSQQLSIPLFSKRNVLIVAANGAAQNLRADVLRSHGVQVHSAKDVAEEELLWVPDFFNLVLLDMRQRSEETLAFSRTIRRRDPKQQIFFFVGPPEYISASGSEKVLGSSKLSEDWGAEAQNLGC